MKNLLFLILVAAIIALFVVPESTIGEYKGLLKIKYGLRDISVKVKDIVTSFARTGEKPAELKELEQAAKDKLDIGIDQLKERAKEQAKDTLKEAATETIYNL